MPVVSQRGDARRIYNAKVVATRNLVLPYENTLSCFFCVKMERQPKPTSWSYMSDMRSIFQVFASDDRKLRRLIQFWAVTAALYLVCVLLLWFEVAVGAVIPGEARWLTVALLGGSLLFYGLIRTSAVSKLTPSQLAFGQGVQALVCIVAAYAIATPVRGAVLTLLLLVLVFCSLALSSRRANQINAFAMLLLGATMIWLVHVDPIGHARETEAVHFVLASSVSVAIIFLVGNFNQLRSRLKAQKSELEQQKMDLSGALVRLEQAARRDEVTLLPNRRYVNEVLFNEEKRGNPESGTRCLALLNIDRFKSINDTYGHAAGDEVLRDFARQAQAVLRSNDVLVRWSSEEFLLLLPNTEQDAAIVTLQRVQQALVDRPLITNRATVHVTFSAGLAVMPSDELLAEAIIRADKAMFRAKGAGRNTTCLYDPQMEAAVTAHEQLKAALLNAILSHQLVLHYQPQVNANADITGAEALVRWQHPDKGLIFPNAFIPIAEESDSIITLGQWVLSTACNQLATWGRHAQTEHLRLSVNVSARQLRDPNFVEQVLSTIEKSGINPERLKLELTESMLVDDVEGAIEKMNRLKSVGVSFSLDDFGTGFSSLSYLKRLPLDEIKIDRSFVSDIAVGREEGIIARAVINLAHSLGFSVIAEGVETTLQRDFLVRNGCSEFQGYLFGRPGAIEDFATFLTSQKGEPATAATVQ